MNDSTLSNDSPPADRDKDRCDGAFEVKPLPTYVILVYSNDWDGWHLHGMRAVDQSEAEKWFRHFRDYRDHDGKPLYAGVALMATQGQQIVPEPWRPECDWLRETDEDKS